MQSPARPGFFLAPEKLLCIVHLHARDNSDAAIMTDRTPLTSALLQTLCPPAVIHLHLVDILLIYTFYKRDNVKNWMRQTYNNQLDTLFFLSDQNNKQTVRQQA